MAMGTDFIYKKSKWFTCKMQFCTITGGTESIFGGLVPTCYPPSEEWELCDVHKKASELHENFA